jgi:hypothetical protein
LITAKETFLMISWLSMTNNHGDILGCIFINLVFYLSVQLLNYHNQGSQNGMFGCQLCWKGCSFHFWQWLHYAKHNLSSTTISFKIPFLGFGTTSITMGQTEPFASPPIF